MIETKKKICWITPDYFLIVDAKRVPQLINDFDINWILINCKNTGRKADGLIDSTFKPKEFNLRYRQKDPRILWQYYKLLREIQSLKPDLVYVSFHGFPFFLPLLIKFIKKDKIIWGIHNVKTPKGASNAKWMDIYQNYIIDRINKFQVFSKYQLSVIKDKVPNKNHYYAPLPLEDYGTSNITPPANVIRFLFFGYIKAYKRLDLLINSFIDLQNSGIENIQLLIAGNCDNWKHYESIIAENTGITKRIEMIPNKDIPDLISSCHYLVLPYNDGAQSGVLNLAYQYNKPVITTDIESFRQLVVDGYTGYTFKNESQESLTMVMKKIIEEHKFNYPILKQNIKQFVDQEFIEDKVIILYRNFLNDCMRN
ncbi:MAG TPA: glycosyltransferase [Ignavibacteriaceae bacterium]|nr:glycosyltransferase [Ignavibacteriaceae bacterium]